MVANRPDLTAERFWRLRLSDGPQTVLALSITFCNNPRNDGHASQVGGSCMRFIVIIVSVLMVLGLAAYGLVSAQKTSTAPSQATASDSAAAPGPRAQPAAPPRQPGHPR